MEAPTGVDRPALRLGIAQLAPRLRDVPANAAAITAAAAADVDILLTPELSLTGYDVGDAVHHLATPVVTGSLLRPRTGRLPDDEPDVPDVAADAAGDVVIGLVEAAPGGPFNTGCVLRQGRVVFRHRKLYLPTYGMFDEGRWFGRGDSLDTWTTPSGWHCGLLICEDFWHPGLAYVLATRGIDLLLVQAAAPGRGVWQGGEEDAFASADVWRRIARTTAQLYGIHVALCNRSGVEGGVMFAGGSLVAGPDGSILAASDTGTGLLEVELTAGEQGRARQPYAHARDDDARLVVRELQRCLP
ncbi:MAG TPA: nitrilase-related carbon-nitrogen hydrolase [Longimicrobiales bacterium]|nr:nitrilase-related carbon-nitrogen hydrolase [Longimicrobiales bacterium]